MENQVTKRSPINVLSDMLNGNGMKSLIAKSMGKNADAFIASVIELANGDKALQACDPKLLIKEAMRAASMHLPLNKALGFAYIVPYAGTPTFIPGYKGYIQLALRTGQYKTINADVVYEGEMQRVSKLTGEVNLDGEKISDKVVGYFAYIEFINGFSKTLYMSVEEMATYAKRYSKSVGKVTIEQLVKKAQEASVGSVVGWLGNFNAMAIKTVLRRLISKYGYLSVDMQEALVSEARTEVNPVDMRNDAVAENANATEINTEEAAYVEVVDTETGEIKQVASEQPQDEEPDF